MLSGIPAFVLFASSNNIKWQNTKGRRLGCWLLRPQLVVLVIIRVGRMRVLRQWMFL